MSRTLSDRPGCTTTMQPGGTPHQPQSPHRTPTAEARGSGVADPSAGSITSGYWTSPGLARCGRKSRAPGRDRRRANTWLQEWQTQTTVVVPDLRQARALARPVPGWGHNARAVSRLECPANGDPLTSEARLEATRSCHCRLADTERGKDAPVSHYAALV